MTHGHGYFVHSGTLYLKREARKKGADIVMFGHTHKPYMEEDEVLINKIKETALFKEYESGKKAEFLG